MSTIPGFQKPKQFQGIPTSQLERCLQTLRERCEHLAKRQLSESSGSLEAEALRKKVICLEHAVVNRMVRAEQLARSLLRAEGSRVGTGTYGVTDLRRPNLIVDLPNDIYQHHILPYLQMDLSALGSLAAVSCATRDLGAYAQREIDALMLEAEALAERIPNLRTLLEKLKEHFGEDAAGILHLLVDPEEWAQALNPKALPGYDVPGLLGDSHAILLQEKPGLLRDSLLESMRYALVANFFRPNSYIGSITGQKSLMLMVVQQQGRLLRYAALALLRDREVVLAAVGQDGMALEYADPTLQADRAIVRVAIQRSAGALSHASLELQDDPEMQQIAGERRISR
jgi:hypothetical protein